MALPFVEALVPPRLPGTRAGHVGCAVGTAHGATCRVPRVRAHLWGPVGRTTRGWGCVGGEVLTLECGGAAHGQRSVLRGSGCLQNRPGAARQELPEYGATFTSVTQRKLSFSFCQRCSLH